MSKYIPVEPEKWGEMVKAMAENRQLKAEVDALKLGSLMTAVDVLAFINLKAEVERLEQQVKYWRIEAETDHARWLRVLEDVERLRKAGDAMANWFRPVAGVESLPAHIVYDAWNAAKEGKQP